MVPTLSPLLPLVNPALPSFLPIRLWPDEVKEPLTSGALLFISGVERDDAVF